METGHPADALIPPGLLAEIEAAAAEERRPARELVGEAVERYLSERRWFRRDEVHAKIAQGLESLRQGKGLDCESVMAELIAEFDGSHPARWCRATSSLPRAGTISARSGTIWSAKANGASPGTCCRKSPRPSACWPRTRRPGICAAI